MTAQKDPEAELSEYFGSFLGGGTDAIRYALTHPVRAVRSQRNIGRLPVIDARLTDDGDADVVLRGLKRPHPFARRMIRGTTAVLPLGADYLSGSTESKRSLRTKVNRGNRRGYHAVQPVTRDDRRRYLDLADDFERNHPDAHYRNANPDNDYLLDLRHWFIAVGGDGTPLLLAAPGISGEWAVLQHFKMLQDSDDARLARFWMSAELVTRLHGLGVRYLADMLSPVGLPPGLRDFQRRLGYRLARVRLTGRVS